MQTAQALGLREELIMFGTKHDVEGRDPHGAAAGRPHRVIRLVSCGYPHPAARYHLTDVIVGWRLGLAITG
jgi:hypothetical protein